MLLFLEQHENFLGLDLKNSQRFLHLGLLFHVLDDDFRQLIVLIDLLLKVGIEFGDAHLIFRTPLLNLFYIYLRIFLLEGTIVNSFDRSPEMGIF